MRGRLEQRLTNFSGGIRKVDATTTGTPVKGGGSDPAGRAPGSKGRREELADGLDVVYDRRTGLLRRRDAHMTPAWSGGPDGLLPAAIITSMMTGSGFPAGQANQVLFSDGANIWRYDMAAGLTGAAILSGLTADSLWHAVMAPQSGGQGPMWMMNGSQARYWTGAAGGAWTAATGTLPIGKYLAYHGLHVWVAGMTALAGVSDPRSALAWSDLGDARGWPSANVTMFDPNDGDEITGIGRIGPYLVVFKRRKTWLVYDLDTSANRQLSAGIGCISHRSIVETPHGLIFMSERGPALCDGAQIKMIEDKLNLMPQIDLQSPQASLTLQVNAASSGDDYYLNIGQAVVTPGPFGDVPEKPLAHYDVLNDAWWLGSRMFTQMMVWNGRGENELWGIFNDGDPEATVRTVLVMHALKGSDHSYDILDGAVLRMVTVNFTLREFDFATDRRKYLRSVTVEGNAVVDITVRHDGVVASFATTARDLTSAAGLQRYTWPRPPGFLPAQRIGVQLHSGEFAFAHPAVEPPPFEIAAVTIHADVRER